MTSVLPWRPWLPSARFAAAGDPRAGKALHGRGKQKALTYRSCRPAALPQNLAQAQGRVPRPGGAPRSPQPAPGCPGAVPFLQSGRALA